MLLLDPEVLMSPGLLLRFRLVLAVGRGSVEEREVLLLRIKRDSREKMSSGSSSFTPFSADRCDRSGDGSLVVRCEPKGS